MPIRTALASLLAIPQLPAPLKSFHSPPVVARLIVTLLFALSVLATGTHALTRFDPTCTLPTNHVNFVSSPDYRGTLDILWSCLFTIIACTWTIQHLNIPEQRDRATEKKDIRHQIRCMVKSFWIKSKWMLFTMVAPEFILGKAICDFIVVWRLKKKVDKMSEPAKSENNEIGEPIIKDYEEWGLSHGFFAIMGGFRVIVCDDTQERDETKPKENTSIGEKRVDNERIEELADRETQGPRTNQIRQLSREWDPPEIKGSWILPPEILLWLRKTGRISRLPNITEEEILDKSKSDVLVKALAALQVFWVTVQVIVRTARGLAVSQLELVVTAFSICAIITYIFLISKPQGVQVPMRPLVIRRDDFKLAPDVGWDLLRIFCTPGRDTRVEFTKEMPMVIPNDSMPHADSGVAMLGYPTAIAIGSLIFGAVHVAGWKLTFPTPIEQKLWRIASIIITSLPLVALTIMSFGGAALDHVLGDVIGSSFLEQVAKLFGFGNGIIYIIARLFLLVETFRSLGFLPPDAYVDTWVSNIPSVG